MTEERQDMAEEAVDAEQDRATACPCCGKPTLHRNVKIDPDMLEHWLSCVISGVPWSRSYDLYGGRIRVRATQLDLETGTLAKRAADRMDAKMRELGSGALYDSLASLKVSLQTLVCVESVEISAQGATPVYEPCKLAVSCLRELLEADPEGDWDGMVAGMMSRLSDGKEMPYLPLPILMSTVQTHIRLLDILMDSGFDEDFWKGIKLA